MHAARARTIIGTANMHAQREPIDTTLAWTNALAAYLWLVGRRTAFLLCPTTAPVTTVCTVCTPVVLLVRVCVRGLSPAGGLIYPSCVVR